MAETVRRVLECQLTDSASMRIKSKVVKTSVKGFLATNAEGQKSYFSEVLGIKVNSWNPQGKSKWKWESITKARHKVAHEEEYPVDSEDVGLVRDYLLGLLSDLLEEATKVHLVTLMDLENF